MSIFLDIQNLEDYDSEYFKQLILHREEKTLYYKKFTVFYYDKLFNLAKEKN